MKRKAIHSATRFSLGVLSMGVLVACGGGGGGGSIGIADGGIRGTGSSVGPVSGFGSVIVNGVRFDTRNILNETVQSNDGITTEDELDEGMILRVDGEWLENGEGTASEVEYDDTLRGPIMVQSFNDTAQTAEISILGLTVNIDRQTVIKGVAQPSDLSNDAVARVSGWRLANGDFRASLVHVHSGSVSSTPFDVDNDVELEGRIKEFDSSPCRFVVGTVEVDCSALNRDSPLNLEDLEDDRVVEVEGNLNDAGDLLIATEIRQDDQRRYRRGTEEDIEISGPVTLDFTDSSGIGSFGLNGIQVNVTSETEFEDGLTKQDLLLGVLVQVEGDYQTDGSIDAEEIELREANAEVEGAIDMVIDESTFTVGGVRVQVMPNTLIESDDDDAVSNPTKEQLLNRLVAGVEVEVEGIERDNGNYLEAVKIEIDEDGEGDSQSFELEGKLRDINIEGNSIEILGVTIRAREIDFDEITRVELKEMLKPDQNQFPILEVEYEKASSVGVPFDYVAEEEGIELKEDDEDD